MPQWNIRRFTKPLKNWDVTVPGGGALTVRAGDLISYREHYEDGSFGYRDGSFGYRLARVLGIATHGGDGQELPENTLAVVAVNETITFGYPRFVPLEEVFEASSPEDAFKKWFFGFKDIDPDLIYRHAEYGSLNNRFIDEYLDRRGELTEIKRLPPV